MSNNVVTVAVSPRIIENHYRSKVAEIGLEQATQVTMQECGLSKEDTIAFLEGRKRISLSIHPSSLAGVAFSHAFTLIDAVFSPAAGDGCIVTGKDKHIEIGGCTFWSIGGGFSDFKIKNKMDVMIWFEKAKFAFDSLCATFEEKDVDVLRFHAVEVQCYLEAFQYVRDQILALKYDCPELIPGVRYSQIVTANP